MHGDAVTGQPGGEGCRSVADSRVMGHEENARTWSPRRVEGREHGGCCWEMGTRTLHCVSYVSLSPVSGTTRGEGQPGKPQVVQRMRPRTPRKPKTRLLERRVACARHFGSWILRYRGGVGIGVDGSGRAADKKHENGPGLVSEGGGLGRCIWARQRAKCRAQSRLPHSLRDRGFCGLHRDANLGAQPQTAQCEHRGLATANMEFFGLERARESPVKRNDILILGRPTKSGQLGRLATPRSATRISR